MCYRSLAHGDDDGRGPRMARPGHLHAAGPEALRRWLVSERAALESRVHESPPCGAGRARDRVNRVGRSDAHHPLSPPDVDPGAARAPADELAALYHERWDMETAFDELKTHLRGAPRMLRALIHEAALGALPRRITRSGSAMRDHA